MSFTYRERHSRNDYGIVSQTPSSLFPPIENVLTEVPGGHGAYFFGQKYGVRQLTVPIAFVWKQLPDFQSRMNILSEWLAPGSEPEPLVFDLEPDKTYYVVLSDQTDIERIGRTGQGELIFICPDPFKYGREQSQSFTDRAMIANEGTMDAYPVFRTTITEDVTLFRIENRNNLTLQGTPRSIILGRSYSPSQTKVEPLTLVMHDTMRSTQSWQTASEVDNGFIAGEMDVNQYGFYPRLVGSAIDMKRWQGPSLFRAIGQPLQDFRIDVFVRLFNVSYETGMIEVYLRNSNGEKVAVIGVEDAWTNVAENQTKVRLGPTTGNWYDFELYSKAVDPWGWNNYDGILRLQREGQDWTAYFAQIRENGQHAWQRSNVRYFDFLERAMTPITHVQVAMRIFPGSEKADMAVKEIKMYKLNKIENRETQVPLSFKAGDIVEVDSSNGLVTVNGEQQLDLIDLQTDFFTLVEGLNELHVSPSFPTEITWRNRYL